MLLRERYRAALGLGTPLRAQDDAATSDRIVTEQAQREGGAEGGATAGGGGGDGGRRRRRRAALARRSGAAAAAAAALSVAPPAALAAALALAPGSQHVVVLRRRTARRIANEVDFLLQLRALKRRFNFTLTEIADWRMPDQGAVFAAFATADVVVGAHGAGQTNNIVAKPGACLVEVMPTDWLVPCYWRMASHLGLRYTMFMVKGDRTPPITIAVRAVVQAVADCLAHNAPPPEGDEGGGV